MSARIGQFVVKYAQCYAGQRKDKAQAPAADRTDTKLLCSIHTSLLSTQREGQPAETRNTGAGCDRLAGESTFAADRPLGALVACRPARRVRSGRS